MGLGPGDWQDDIALGEDAKRVWLQYKLADSRVRKGIGHAA